MRLSELDPPDIVSRLGQEGLVLDFGLVRARIRSDVTQLASALRTVYSTFEPGVPEGIFDVTVNLRHQHGLRRWVRPQVEFVADARKLFQPFPADTHLPLLEWGMNFLLAGRLSAYLLLHAGAVALGRQGIILPAMPGSGKSTLTAALSLSGFRLLSDEFGVVGLADGLLRPLLRPVALKNESIDVIAHFSPEATLGPRFPKTRKGTVAHLAPTASAVESRHELAVPRLIVFPNYDRTIDLELELVPKARAFARLSINSFNYEMLGLPAFDIVGRLVQSCDCYRLSYRNLDRAIDGIRGLVDRLPN